MLLEDLTWEDAREWAKKNPVVIVPLGSTEQHGPHLPLKVDIASADYIARAVGEKTESLVTPPLNFGYSELWHTYPGTISFSAETFRKALHDICYSLIRSGFKKIFLLNGHNPNLILMQAAAYELVDKYEDKDISIAVATYIFMAKEKCDEIGENFRDGTHANEMETSIMMYLFGDKVKGDKVKEVADDYKMRKCISFDSGACIVNRWPDSRTYSGTYGNPGTASKEKGKLYLDALIEDISQFVLDFSAGKFNPIGKDGVPQDRI
jgi:creatinine amidohydrolase